MRAVPRRVLSIFAVFIFLLASGCLNLPGYDGPDGSTDADTGDGCGNGPACTDGLICNESWGVCGVADCSGQDDFTPCEAITEPDRSYDICVSGVCVSPGCGDPTCNTPGPHFPLPDTNLRLCYDEVAAMTCTSFPCGADGSPEFCGQDAQYGWDTNHDSEERFTRDLSVSGEPVVTDNVTGLMWQGCAAGLSGDTCNAGADVKADWTSALSVCDDLEWVGQTDWRLPDNHELLSIVDFGKLSWPAIDTLVFPFTPENPMWTSSTYMGDETSAWSVSFLHGTGQYGPKTDTLWVRCVRGLPTPQPERFERHLYVPDEPIVEDKATGLTWQGCDRGRSGTYCGTGDIIDGTWSSALSYCEGLSWGGEGAADWRLPNVKELESIIDYRGYLPPVDATAFPQTSTLGHWSSSSIFYEIYSLAWVVFFDTGNYHDGEKTLNGATRCVRGGL